MGEKSCMDVLALGSRSSNSTTFICLLLILSVMPCALSFPFIVLYGISDSCTSKGVSKLTQYLANNSGAQGYCIEIGDGAWDSWVMPLTEQMEIACEKVKKMDELSDGYNIVALSQGNMVARGLIEFCDDGPQVKSYISLAGPHAGIASVPYCGVSLVCVMVDYLMEYMEIYSSFVQEHLAPSNYIKIPTDIKSYIEGCKYLPKVNNEVISARNSTYKERFASLENLVLVMFENDSVLVPRETSWFGYFPDGSTDTILQANETLLYTEDWIGLKALDDAGKVKYVAEPGGHLAISDSLIEKHILPYLEDEESTQVSMVTRSSN